MTPTAKKKRASPAVKLPAELTQARRFGKTRSAQSGALLEDYVELIDDLLTSNGEARPTDVARRLGVSHATAIKTIARAQTRRPCDRPPLPRRFPDRGRTKTRGARADAASAGRRYSRWPWAFPAKLRKPMRKASSITSPRRRLKAFAQFLASLRTTLALRRRPALRPVTTRANCCNLWFICVGTVWPSDRVASILIAATRGRLLHDRTSATIWRVALRVAALFALAAAPAFAAGDAPKGAPNCVFRRPDRGADAGRPPARRSHAAVQAAGGDGAADRRPDARAVAVRARSGRIGSTRCFPQRQRAEGDARRRLAIRHPACCCCSPAWRPISSWCGRPDGPRFSPRSPASPCRSPAASRSANSCPTRCCPTRQAADHLAVSRHRAVDRLGARSWRRSCAR